MSHSSRDYIPTNRTILLQAYAPVLLERKAAAIRKTMDEEKASGVVIRTAINAEDRQCV